MSNAKHKHTQKNIVNPCEADCSHIVPKTFLEIW